jgi:hypothetical protein
MNKTMYHTILIPENYPEGVRIAEAFDKVLYYADVDAAFLERIGNPENPEYMLTIITQRNSQHYYLANEIANKIFKNLPFVSHRFLHY